MITALWIVQVLLALMFAMAGAMKVSQPTEKLAQNMGWVKDFSAGNVRLIGALELLAAIGLVLPVLVGVLPSLTAWAATGLVVLMVGAAVTHARRKELTMIGVNVVLLALAAFVAFGRFTTGV